ncbi:unnamed protein product [Rhizoctonia solani]|uniref:Uncharacterized protein n=1 Tax=Rhizoctonia solani TaxID=456999 RepID=A0A8H3I6N9_9AGAM|nr:unnamed protein product [Rhizoctonia solani]
MVKFILATALLALSNLSSASPAPAKTEGGPNGRYRLYNNLFGSGAPGTSGSQKTWATFYNGLTIKWETQFHWSGNPSVVKSYANVALRKGLPRRVTAIRSIPTVWEWHPDEAGLPDADVSYDLWLSYNPKSSSASSDSTVEIMIWIGHHIAVPSGMRLTVARIDGRLWTLFKGYVGTWTVYTFVAPSNIYNYHADLKWFLTYLHLSYCVDLNQYLVEVQAGTEPFIGSSKITTTKYRVEVNPPVH